MGKRKMEGARLGESVSSIKLDRKTRNRLSAAASRRRKELKMAWLEARVADLERENASLREMAGVSASSPPLFPTSSAGGLPSFSSLPTSSSTLAPAAMEYGLADNLAVYVAYTGTALLRTGPAT